MRRTLAVLLACALTSSASWAAQLGTTPVSIYDELPELGSPANALLSRTDESQIGWLENLQLRKQGVLLGDPEVNDYLQNLGMRLASQAKLHGQTFHYQCIRSSQVNSEASFGGYVYIFSALILYTQNEAQLAAVMAHETGHILQRHLARRLEADRHMSVESAAGLLAAILVGAAAGGNGQGAVGAIAMSQAISMQRQINFTRSEEVEADAVGIHLLASAGYDPYQMANVFQSMERLDGLSESEVPALLIDHPVFPDRIAHARELAAQLDPAHPRENSVLFPFIKERVRVLAASPDADMLHYYASLGNTNALTPAQRYGQALARIRAEQAGAAVPELRQLVANYPQLTLLYTALGHALAASGQTAAALSYFASAEQLFPNNVPLTVRYARTLLTARKPQQALTLLLDVFDNVDPTPGQIRLTAQAANAAGDTGDAYYYMALYQLATDNLALANRQLTLALSTPGLSAVQRARFSAQLRQVRTWMRERQQAGGHAADDGNGAFALP